MKLAVGVVLCMQDQYGVFPPLAAIIAARRRDMLGTRHCRRSTRISAHVSSRAELNKILGRAVHTGDYTAQFIPNMLYGVAVWRSCRLLHLGDVALLKEIKDSLIIMRCVVTVLVAVIIPEMLPGKWHLGVSQNAPVQLCRHLSGTTRGDLKSSLDVYRTTTSLDPISLTPLLEALTSKTYSKPAIYQVKLEYWLVNEESMMPTGHCQVLPPLHPLQAETAGVGSQQGLSCGPIGTVTTGQKPVVFQIDLIPYKFLIGAVKARALMKQSCRAILNKAWSWRGVVFRGAPVDLPGTKVPVVACLRRMWLTVARVRPTRPAITLCCMPSLASAMTSCLIPKWVG